MDEIKECIIQATLEAQSLIDREFAKWEHGPPEDSGFEQEGLLNGKEIVEEYLAHSEPGLALEHLIYMVAETDIALSETARNKIGFAASKMNLDVKL